MIALAAIRKVAEAVPLWVYAALVALAFGFYLGHSRMVEKFDKYKQDQAKVVQEWKTKAETINTQTVTEYVDRVQVVHEKGDTIVKKVPVYVPRNVCVLPPGFRSVLDSAATGSDLPDPSRKTDASPAEASGPSREAR